MIPKKHRERVKFVMKDGDPQQRNEIIGALMNIFPNAIEGGCGYHIVHTTWEKYVPGKRSLSKQNQAKYDDIKSKIQKWIYSWMKSSYVEDEQEYKISKFLLLQFISSGTVLSAFDGKMIHIVALIKWLRGYVLVWESLFLFYLRKDCRNFLTAHSSPHEV